MHVLHTCLSDYAEEAQDLEIIVVFERFQFEPNRSSTNDGTDPEASTLLTTLITAHEHSSLLAPRCENVQMPTHRS